MTTRELIDRLQKCDLDAPVVITMYEDNMAIGMSDDLSLVTEDAAIYTTGEPFVHIMAEKRSYPPYREREEITIEDWEPDETDD